MTKIQKIIYSVIAIYIVTVAAMPAFGRLRVFLFLAVIVACGLLIELDIKTRFYFVAALGTAGLFFLKIIPTPYQHLVSRHLPMSYGIILSIISIFGSTVAVFFLVRYLLILFKISEHK
ncbi:MAG: hypothetical protein WCG48_01555 [Candidatus Berkelbacteria bacterium]